MANAMLRAALIILSFNHVEDTIECLQSVCPTKPATADVIVVDNASESGTVAEIRRAFPDVQIIELQRNMGWAGGNNVGIRSALKQGYDLICLMNNDLVFCNGALRNILQVAQNIEPCLLHPHLYYYGEPDKQQLGPPQQSEPISGHDDLYALNFAYGACLIIHAQIFHSIGLIDERYFLQLEETDFYLRAIKAGFRSLCYANARVLHKESVSLGGKQSPVKIYYMIRNSLLIIEDHAKGIVDGATGLRRFIWTLRNLAGDKVSMVRFLRWFCSGDAGATAARAGIRDYALRRFGCMSDATMRSLSKRSI